MKRISRALLLSALGSIATTAWAQGGQFTNAPNKLPTGVEPVSAITYDGVTDDLLTAGLGTTGIGGARPAPIDPTKAADLRRLAIYVNYRALIDPTVLGGYSRFYGPNIDLDGGNTLGEGKIAGTEYIAVFDTGARGRNVTLMVQVPTTFNPSKPCIITATSSGSRGIYGAIGTAGDWGLKRGCAVAYADKGSGNGVHDLQDNTINRINGVRADATAAGDDTVFTAPISALQRQQFNSDWPNRYSVKHAHSQLNPEKDWGQNTLSAVEYAFFVLNEKFGSGKKRTITPENTIVIASSVSNGAGAALQAAEQDNAGLIDGVAVSEPNIQVSNPQNPPIRRGSTTYTGGSKPLYEYFTFANLYQPCASLVPGAYFNIVNSVRAQNRCQSLADAGLLSGPPAQWPQEAMARLVAYGWQPESSPLQASHYALATPAIATTYSNTYGRFSVLDNLCGFSFAATDLVTNFVTAAKPPLLPTSFGDGNGVPPMIASAGISSGITLVNNLDPRGPTLDSASKSPSTDREDFNFDGALCQRGLWIGGSERSGRVTGGVAQVQQSAKLRGKPTLIVHGRADALIPVNFNSRSYIAYNHLREPKASNVRYVEVTNAQHFESFLPLPGYSTAFIPLHVYFIQAMNLMWNHLTTGAALPASQVVRTTPRPTAATPLSAAMIPPISASPAAADAITFDGNTLVVPD